jgi:6-phosphogluconolactonase
LKWTIAAALASSCAACVLGSEGSPPSDDPSTLDTAASGATKAYVSGGGQIALYSVDVATGTLTLVQTVQAGPNPGFLALSPAERYLYAADPTSPGQLFAFSVNATSARLALINETAITGNRPAHVGVDATGKWLATANYGDGTVSLVKAAGAAGIGATVTNLNVGAEAHEVVFSPQNTFLFAACKGADHVARMKFNAATGTLSLDGEAATFPTGSGPRHLTFSADSRFVYVVTEEGNTINAFSYNQTTGAFSHLQTLSTLPPSFIGTNTAAEVHLHPSGKWLYVSNRGANDIARFSVNASTGLLAALDYTPTGGSFPRDFDIDPSGVLLLAANQQSGDVFAFKISATGALHDLGKAATAPTPFFVGMFHLP